LGKSRINRHGSRKNYRLFHKKRYSTPRVAVESLILSSFSKRGIGKEEDTSREADVQREAGRTTRQTGPSGKKGRKRSKYKKNQAPGARGWGSKAGGMEVRAIEKRPVWGKELRGRTPAKN